MSISNHLTQENLITSITLQEETRILNTQIDETVLSLAHLYHTKCLAANLQGNQGEMDLLFNGAISSYKILIERNSPRTHQAKMCLIKLSENLNKPLEQYQKYCEEIIGSDNEQDRQQAAAQLGGSYEQGTRTKRDLKLARHYWEIAAKTKNLLGAHALYRLGIIWKEHEQNLKKAGSYFQKVVKCLEGNLALFAQQDSLSLYNLGSIYMNGDGVRKKLGKAQVYLENAFLLAKGNFKYFAIKALLILNMMQKNEENMSFLAEQLTRCNRASNQELCKRIGGKYLLSAMNTPDMEEAYEKIYPFVTKQRETVEKKLLATLISQKSIPKERQPSFKYPKEGVCLGMALQFLSSFKEPCTTTNMKKRAIAAAVPFQCRPGITAVAIQAVAQGLDDVYVPALEYQSALKFFLDQAEISCQIQIPEQIRPSVASWIGRCLINQSIYKAVNLSSAGLLGLPYVHTAQQQLSLLMQQDCGYFLLLIETPQGKHALSLIKDATTVLLWDPSFGLVNCGKNPISFIPTFLSMQYHHHQNHAMIIHKLAPTTGN